VRRGCIAVGNIECDGCHHNLHYGEHYLVIDEEGKGRQRFCIDCCVSHGYITHRTQKGKHIDTFLPSD
jgi:hypothetical protein